MNVLWTFQTFFIPKSIVKKSPRASIELQVSLDLKLSKIQTTSIPTGTLKDKGEVW